MIDPWLLSHLALRVIATIVGSVGILSLVASFFAPPLAAYTIVCLGTATAITLAIGDSK